MAKLFQFILLCIMQLYSFSLNIPILHAYHLCPHHQSLSLLNFKDTLQIDTYKKYCILSHNGYYFPTILSSYCDRYNKPIIEPKISSWNSSTDCCTWGGVTCDEFTGKVIELDLSASQLIGVIDSNSSIFQLSHLKKLNLAYNDLSSSEMTSEFRKFTHLSHLNLTRTGFTGEIPSEISQLNELVSLDLSGNSELLLNPHVFKTLLQNMTRLRELSLRYVPISSSLPKNFSSSLTTIDLSSTKLQGTFPYHIFHLPNLRQLSLSYNSFDGFLSLASVKWNTSSPLQNLELADIEFSGKLSDTMGNLKHLTNLDISSCELNGTLPWSLGNLTQLTHLDLSRNNFTGRIPPGILRLEHLTVLDISWNKLKLPEKLLLQSLKFLSLEGNNLTPSSISVVLKNLTQLEAIDLSYNPLYEIPHELFQLSLLQEVSLAHTQLQGPFPNSFSNLVNLRILDLSYTNLTGPIETDTLSNLVNLRQLDLSSNNFNSTLDVKFLSNYKWMDLLDLSFSSLSLINESNTTLPMISIRYLDLDSCNIRNLDVLRSIEVVNYLNLRNNNIHGEIPEWVWSNWSNLSFLYLSNNLITHIGSKVPLESLEYLDLGSNLLQGHLPVLPRSLRELSLSNNQFHGEIESSICELSRGNVLDLSNNSFSGTLPKCIVMMNNGLVVLDLHMNHLHGTIPDSFFINKNLVNLNLRGNHFEGKVPRSLINCSSLEVLDLSENNFSDAFPIWLGDLPNLRVLSLRSNKFYGNISSSHTSEDAFSELKILDLSYNHLSGEFPPRLLQRFKRMMIVDEGSGYYFGDHYNSSYYSRTYYYSMTMVWNGNIMQVERILEVTTVIDLSCNHFEGEIPDSIGGLDAIQQLNISHNNFTGRIPQRLGKLSNLHSLDLSSNQLDGSIPNQLADLGFLAVLNLSCNHLTGQIPNGRQLQSIPNDSYIGNDGLCGFPLTRKCGNENTSTQPPHDGFNNEEDHEEMFDGFTWQSVVMGYGVGIFVGFAIGSLMLFNEKPKWFILIVQEEVNRII